MAQFKADFERDGFVVIRNLISEDKVAHLLSAGREAERLARAGLWPHVRTVGKQFPPWDASLALKDGIWGVQHLMHPSLPGHEAFTAFYFSDETLTVARGLMGCGEEDLTMELLNMLVSPASAFSLSWHRDDVPWDVGAEEELARLKKARMTHAQYNLALTGDESLVVVPGSHRRARSEEERGGDMAGQVVVKLGAGDAVFYDGNVLHRGVYEVGGERVTLHGSVGGGSGERARNVLQHGVGGWAAGVDLSALPARLGQRAEGMRERLVGMGRESGGVVEYSLRG